MARRKPHPRRILSGRPHEILKFNHSFSAKAYCGRLELHADVFTPGADILILLTGGQSHLGGMAVSTPQFENFINLPAHRDGEAALHLARIISSTIKSPVAVCAGIHYDNLQESELGEIFNLIGEIAGKILNILSDREKKLLKISQIDEFIEKMRSGRLEEEFKNSGETGRGEILELLERLMDAGEMADEVATRLIFRGLPQIK